LEEDDVYAGYKVFVDVEGTCVLIVGDPQGILGQLFRHRLVPCLNCIIIIIIIALVIYYLFFCIEFLYMEAIIQASNQKS
jgi:hypothetical protein